MAGLKQLIQEVHRRSLWQVVPSELTPTGLRLDPTWDSLRDHPRFQALLEKYEKAAR